MNGRAALSSVLGLSLALLLTVSVRAAGPNQLPSGDLFPEVKLEVVESGLYRIGYAHLSGVGFPVDAVDPRHLQVHVGGVEVAVWVDGEADGVFDPEDSLVFYGEALDTVYSGVNLYWLPVGREPGLRMSTREAVPTGEAASAHSFTETLHAEVNSFYWQTMPAQLGPDHWFWGTLLTAPERRNYSLATPGGTGDQPARIRVRLLAETTAANRPTHQVQARVNGALVGETFWDGRTAVVLSGTVPGETTATQSVTLTLDAVSTGQHVSRVHLDWIEFDYARGYTAANDALIFGGPGTGRYAFNIGGFAGNDPTLFDISDPGRPVDWLRS